MTVNVGANVENPTHHISLSDGSTLLGLMAVNPLGKNDIKQIRRAPYPRTSLKISQGDSQYGDNELPYVTKTQENWAGGRGQEMLEADTTRFYDSYRACSQFENKVFPGSMDFFFSKSDSKVIKAWSGNVSLLNNSNAVGVARRFQAGASFNVGELHLLIKFTYAVGSGNLTVGIHNDSAGAIGSSIYTFTVYENTGYNLNKLIQHYVLKPTSTAALTSGNYYWIKITGSDFSRWDFGVNPTADATYVDVGAGYVLNTSVDLCFAIVEDANITGGKFFDYKGAKYCYQNYSGGSRLMLNGDRGVADASASTTLVDATKTWTTDEWAGCRVLIIHGTGADQSKSYRTISSNTSTTLTVSASWDIVPDTNTEYVILGSAKWQALTTFSYQIRDVAIAEDFFYIAFGAEDTVKRYQYYNSAGVYTSRNDAEGMYAEKLLSIYSPGEKRYYLYGSAFVASYPVYGKEISSSLLWKMSVPPAWGDLYHEVGILLEPGDAMEWRFHRDTGSNAVRYTTNPNRMKGTSSPYTPTGYLGYHNLDQVTDLFSGGANAIAFAINAEAQAIAAGDLQLALSRAPNVGFGEPAVVFNDGTNFKRCTLIVDRYNSSLESPYEQYFDFDTSTDALYIGSPYPFNKVSVAMGGAVNTAPATVTVQYYRQVGGWTAVASLSDGTASGGATLAQDGDITYTMPTNWGVGVENYTGGAEANWAAAGNDAPVDYYWLKITVSANLTDPMRIAEVWVEDSNGSLSINLPACAVSEFTWAELVFSTSANNLHARECRSIGLNNTDATQIVTITIDGGIKLISTLANYITFHGGRVLNMASYGDEISNPWLITTEGIYEIQTENNDAVVKIPLDELKQTLGPDSGKAMETNDVYLYFNLERRLERYYNRTLEDVGPDREEGLEYNRAGIITDLVSYPGSILGVVNSESTYRSSILERKGSGWHDIYVAPYYEYNIHSISAQPIPGQVNRLWIMMGDSIIYIYVPISANDNHNAYVYQSYLTTSWISMGYLDVGKRFTSIKLYTEDLGASSAYIHVEYQLETDSASWTRLSTTVTTSPYQEVSLGASGLSGKRIRFRFVFEVRESMTIKPVLKAWVLEALMRMPVKHSYTIPVRVSDLETPLFGPDDQKTRAETVQAQLDAWAAGPPTILTFRCNYSPYDNKTVIVEPPPMQPTSIVVGTSPDAVETHTAEIMLLEV